MDHEIRSFQQKSIIKRIMNKIFFLVAFPLLFLFSCTSSKTYSTRTLSGFDNEKAVQTFIDMSASERKVVIGTSKGERKGFLTMSANERKGFLTMSASERKGFLTMSASERKSFLSFDEADRGEIATVFSKSNGNQNAEELIFRKGRKPGLSEWAKEFSVNVPKGGDPFRVAGKLAGQRLNAYLSLKDRTFPGKIPLPKLPPKLELRQEEFELDAEFEERVKKETAKRQKVIEKLQADYRKKVEKRNEQISLLKSLADRRKKGLKGIRQVFVRDALIETLQGFEISSPELDKKTGDVYLDVKSTAANYRERVAVNTVNKKDLRIATLKTPGRVDHTVEFAIGEKGDVTFSGANLLKGAQIALGKPADPDRKIDASRELVAVVDSASGKQGLEELRKLQKQNPNLVDSFETGSVVYNDGRTLNVSYKDDIPALLKKASAYPTDKSRWLLVIGAEKYRNTDHILFAKRSAELFTEAAAKSLGIRKGNIVGLYDDEATSGNIKHNVKRLLENVKKGDTVYFYYNGHGVPVPEKDNEPYILPTDMIPDYVSEDPFFSLSVFYKNLTDSKAGKVIAFVDSCFTGLTDNKSVYKGTKAATRLAPKKASFNEKKMALITAGTDKQFSNAYEEKGHRLFTYFVIKSLLAGRKDVKNLYREVSVAVNDSSTRNGLQYKQDPVIFGNENLEL